jgi:hypothetical protein
MLLNPQDFGGEERSGARDETIYTAKALSHVAELCRTRLVSDPSSERTASAQLSGVERSGRVDTDVSPGLRLLPVRWPCSHSRFILGEILAKPGMGMKGA